MLKPNLLLICLLLQPGRLWRRAAEPRSPLLLVGLSCARRSLCTIIYSLILYLYTSVYYEDILCYDILYYTILHYTILYYTILCYIILSYTILGPGRTAVWRAAERAAPPRRGCPAASSFSLFVFVSSMFSREKCCSSKSEFRDVVIEAVVFDNNQ